MIHLLLLAALQQPERSVEHELYRAQMFAVESALRLGEPAVARAWLDETHPNQRGFEWRVHDAALDESVWSAAVGEGHVSAIDVHKGGEKLVCGTSKGLIEVRDAVDGRVVHSFAAHAEGISQLRFDPAGRRLISASFDRTVKVWDYIERTLIHEFKGHKYPIGGAAFSPDGQLAASCSYERQPDCVLGVLHVWNPADGTIVRTLHGGQKPLVGLAFSPDGKHIAAGSWHFCVFVWSVEGGEPVRCAMPDEGKYNAVDDVAWSPDSTLVVGASRDGTVRVWRSATGELISSLRAHTDAVRGVAFDSTGKTLVTTSADGSVGLWNTSDWTLHALAKGHVDDVEDVAFVPKVEMPTSQLVDSKTFFTSSLDRTVRAWDSSATSYGGVKMRNDAATYAVRFSPDDAVLATCSYDGRIQLWSSAASDLLASWQAHPANKSCHALDWTSDGRRLVSGSWEPVVRVWDVFTRKELAHIDLPSGTTALDVAPDDQRVAVAGAKSVTVWRLDDGKQEHEFTGHSKPPSSVRVSPDSKACVSTARDGKALVWELATGNVLHTLEIGETDVVDAAFSKDGMTIVVAGRGGSVTAFRASDGSKIAVIARSRHGIDHIAIAPDGSRVALASNFASLVDLRRGGLVGELRSHVDGTYDVAFDSTGTRLATCSTDKTIAIADVRPAREREGARTWTLMHRRNLVKEVENRTGRGAKLSDLFSTWMATPPWDAEQPREPWIEYWIQHGASAAR